MKALIGVPTGRGEVRSEMMISLFETDALLRERGYDTDLIFMAFAEPSLARNMIAQQFLATDADILVMQDDDVSVSNNVVQRIIELGKEFTGIYLPQRKLNFRMYASYVQAGMGARQALQAANPPIGRPVDIDNTIIRTDLVSAGFLVLHRSVFSQIDDGFGANAYVHHAIDGDIELKGYFDNITDEDSGCLLSEDFSFCRRYLNSGGEIFAYKGPGITHYGVIGFDS
jgi:hypothetical protein